MKKISLKYSAYLFLLAPIMFFVLELIAALAWDNPKYSYLSNYVSDLGVPIEVHFQGRMINSPLFMVINIGFIVFAILSLVAFIKTKALFQGGLKTTGFILAILYSIGFVLVGLFPGYDWWGGVLHSVGAVLIIFGGNVALICFGFSTKNAIQQKCFFRTSLITGFLGLIGISICFYCIVNNINYQGFFERMAIYPFLVWELIYGITIYRKLNN